MIRSFWLFVAFGALAGCQTDTGSVATAELSFAASSAIAGDMVSRLAEQVGPGTTVIVLKPDQSVDGRSLADALKAWGYAVATNQKTDDTKVHIELVYTIDRFEGQTLARLSTGKVELTRAYNTNEAGATPFSPLSIMQRS